jgi:sensor domain CHASE-containing protein
MPVSSAETHHQNNRLEQLLKVVVLPVAARVTAAPAPNAATLAGAGLICAVAVAAMIGWYVKSVSLVQILPGLVPMQFNSALGFLFCGIALASGVIQARRVALVAAALAFTIGTLTLFEYVPGVSIGIDEIFVTHFTNEQTLYQGRMAVATAISFTFAGASILLLNYPRSINWRPVVVACTGSIIIGMGVVSHIGYISSTDYSYGFGIFSRMAIHTAAGFEIIGASLVTIAWRETRKKTNRIPEWLAIPVGISVAAIAFVLWQTLAIDEDIKIERSINIRSESAALKIENQFTQPAQALIRMGVIWEIEGGTSRELWEAQALSYLSSISSMKAIALIDPSLRVQWVMPPGAVNRLQGLDLSLNPKQKTVIEEAIESRATTDANSIEGAQVSGVVNVYVPIFIDNQFDGLILAELDVGALLQSVSEEFDAVGYVLALYEDDTEVYVSPNAEERAEQWEHTSNFEIQGKTWHMAIWPTEDRLGELKTNIPLFTLFTGLLMAAITAVGINQAQTAGSRARLIAETNLELSAEVRRRTAVEQNLRDLNTNLVSRTSDLQEATTNLEIEVEERKRIEESLVSNTHELERSNSELERFAYVASHDLQTPIRTIIGFSQILAED